MTGESGSFGFPSDSSQTYSHCASCAWVISTTPSKVGAFQKLVPIFLINYIQYDVVFLKSYDSKNSPVVLKLKVC